jgi:4-hydroxybenzoyl-CoA thioesterase
VTGEITTATTETRAPFTTSVVLGFADCDPAGMAFYPSLIRLINNATEELSKAAGSPWPQMIRSQRIGMPTVKLDVDFLSPALHGDRLVFGIVVVRLGRSSIELRHVVTADERKILTARHVLATISLDTRKSIATPPDLRAGLERYLGADPCT